MPTVDVCNEKYNNGEMGDYIPSDEDIKKGWATMPKVDL